MRNNYKLTLLAEQDIDDIVSYISEENPSAALKLLDDIFAQLEENRDSPP